MIAQFDILNGASIEVKIVDARGSFHEKIVSNDNRNGNNNNHNK